MQRYRSHSSEFQPELEFKLQIPNLGTSILHDDHLLGRDEE